MEAERRLAARLRPVDLGDAASGDPAHTDRRIQVDRTGRDRLDPYPRRIRAHLHDGPFAATLLDLRNREIECLLAIVLDARHSHEQRPRVSVKYIARTKYESQSVRNQRTRLDIESDITDQLASPRPISHARWIRGRPCPRLEAVRHLIVNGSTRRMRFLRAESARGLHPRARL